MKDMERLKNALGIDSSIIEQQYFTMKFTKRFVEISQLRKGDGR
jgi:hypothetical protein